MPTIVVRKTRDPRAHSRIIAKVVLSYFVLIALSIVFLIPFGWMLSTSLTEKSRVIVKDRTWVPSVQIMTEINGVESPLYHVRTDATAFRRFLNSIGGGSDEQLVAMVGSPADGRATVQRVIGGEMVQKVVGDKTVWQLADGKLSGKSWTCDVAGLVEASRTALMWKNYADALTVLPFGLFLKNTLIITFACIFGQVLSASLVAFGFSRMHFWGRDALFILVLSTMMLPAQVTQIPTFILFTHLQWIDTLKPLIVPAFFGGGAFFIFLLRQFFMTLPGELEDAAKMDGCSPLGIYWNVAIPLSKPALATVAVFSFMAHWNDFMGPLIYIQSMENKTLALGLTAFKTLHGTEYHLMMAASVAVLMPVLIIFFSAQKYFVKGIVMSGIKG